MFIVFLSSYRNTSESLGEREMLWDHEPHAFYFLITIYMYL